MSAPSDNAYAGGKSNEDSGEKKLPDFREEWVCHLTQGLLPFWFSRSADRERGGFITQFDRNGNDVGTDEKSLIAQARMVYSFSASARRGYEKERCAELARHGFEYLVERMWDGTHGGFFWMTDRKGAVTSDKKVVYGLSFAIYALSEFYLAFGDRKALEYACMTFDLLMAHASDLRYGGFYEMFRRNWDLCGPGSAGGDRKTLDVHMHLMEAFTALTRASGRNSHMRRLEEVISLLTGVIFDGDAGVGIPQFYPDWSPAPQIKFDIIWGWDRFAETGKKDYQEMSASYGHDLEFLWLLLEALDVLDTGSRRYDPLLRKILSHVINYGVDREYGGVFVEGPAGGHAFDLQKEFWQQAEAMIGLLDAYLLYREEPFLEAYERVHRFVFDHVIAEDTGEWLPLLERDGTPVWTHMGTSWKTSYHTVRSALMCIERLDRILCISTP